MYPAPTPTGSGGTYVRSPASEPHISGKIYPLDISGIGYHWPKKKSRTFTGNFPQTMSKILEKMGTRSGPLMHWRGERERGGGGGGGRGNDNDNLLTMTIY